jgi:multiple sugar transport system permease protein
MASRDAAAPSPLARLANWISRHDRILFPAPALLVVLGMLVFPVVYTLYLSFYEWSGGVRPPVFVGLDNYRGMLQESRFWASVWRTAYFTLLAVGSQLLLGLVAALAFHRTFWGRGTARTLFLFPMVATPAAMALVWKFMLDPTLGILGHLLKSVGLPPILWISDERWVLPALAIVDTWSWTPLVMIIVLAGLAALPSEPYEAARIDGATPARTFFSITLPLLRPALMVALMFRVIDAIKTFDIILIITQGGPNYASEILNTYAFSESLNYFHFGYGSTLLVALGALVFAVALLFARLRRGGGY